MILLRILSKVSPFVVLKGHWDTFGNVERKHKWADVFLFYLLPVGLAWWILKWVAIAKLDRTIDNMATVLAIFIPLSFSILAELLGILNKETTKRNDKLRRLAQDLYWNVSYAILVALVFLCALVAVDFFSLSKGKAFCLFFAWMAGHIALTALMLLKRFSILMINTCDM